MRITLIGTGTLGSAFAEQLDAGGMANARYREPLGGLNIYLGYDAGLGTSIAPALLTH